MKYNENSMTNLWYASTALSCFLFPLGLIGIIICTVIECTKNIGHNKAVLYSGIASAIFSTFMILTVTYISYTGSLGTYFLAIIYAPGVVVSVYLLLFYAIIFRRSRIFRKCIILVREEHITSINTISEIVGKDEKRITSVLQRIIKMGELSGAEVDVKKSEVIFFKSIWAKQIVECYDCGAELTVDCGHTLVCEYCGSALHTKALS